MDSLIDRLKSRPRISEWVFPSPKKSKGHLVALDHPFYALRERAGIPDIHPHDLRRTLGSWQSELGTNLQIVAKSLGHQSARSTEVYSRVDIGAVRNSVRAATNAMLAAAQKKLSSSAS
jgi:integrase